ncbi:MAG: outer membrane beta-barrel protein [Geopsychrobacter sp.]|nr:outer membrane beta-barrel protein [Geopsychrobacter sp.]
MRNFFSVALVVLLFSTPVFAAGSATDIPLGQSVTTDDLFNTQRGYFHPALNLSEIYTDNLFNTKANTAEEYITVITPSLWLAFPGQLQPAEPLDTDTTAAGGLTLGRFGEKDERPFQAYLSYEANIKRHKNASSEDITTHKARGLLRGTLASGLSVEFNDVYTQSYDAYAATVVTEQSKFDSNLAALKADIPLGERFKVRLDYSNFVVDYDNISNNFRDRTDNKVTGTFFYAVSQKTRLFGQYGFLDVSYDTQTSNDSTQQSAYLGIDYNISEKVQALVKVGYNRKDRSGSLSELNDFVYEVQADYQFTPKNNLNLTAWRKQKETDDSTFNGILGNAFSATFSQELGQRIVASVQGGWARDDYSGAGSTTVDRTDDYVTMSLSLSYVMQRWFEISGGYNYVNRDSNVNELDYDSNGLFVSLTGKL